MDLLYDYQMFSIQKFGGISRIFIELMRTLSAEPDCAIHWHRGVKTDGYDISSYQAQLKRYFALENIPFSHHPSFQKTLNQLTFRGFNQLLGKPYDIYHPSYYDAALLDWVSTKRLAVTICDMIPEKLLADQPKFQGVIQAKDTLVRQADIIFSISESTKQDLIEFLHVDPAKVKVTPLASRMPELDAIPQLPAWVQQQPYFLYVGTRSRYKNFNILVQAMAADAELKETFQVICFGGSSEFLASEIAFQTEQGVQKNFHYLSGSDALLKALYSQAQALVYPSRYEGFGLPPLEAMTCGCPVVCCPTSSLPEVVGTAATFFESDSVAGLVQAMKQVTQDTGYRQAAIQAGLAQSQLFSWQKTAELTLMGYRSIL